MPVSDIILQVLLGILLADLISGIVHWFEDTYGDPTWPVIGPTIILPNILHHDVPLKFTEAPFWKRNRGVFGVALIFGGVFSLLGWLNPVTITALVVGSFANEVHRWAHLKPTQLPWVIRALQRAKILQTAQHHWAHHRHGYNTHYCTITNALNPSLDGLRVFRIIEGVVEGVFGIKPRTDRDDYTHPLLGRRWIDRARRIACAASYNVRRRLSVRRAFA